MERMIIVIVAYPFSHLFLQKWFYYCKYSLKDPRLIDDIDCLYSDRKAILKHTIIRLGQQFYKAEL